MINTIKLKICGMKEARNIEEVCRVNTEFMGFIFYKKSPRYVGEHFNLSREFPKTIKKVGVFVNETVQEIIRQANRLKLNVIQLHGDETEQQCRDLRENGFKVIKVFSVDDQFNFEKTQNYKNLVDYFLFDTKGKYFGGNATTFDWTLLKKYDQEIPFFLSGGITSSNVHQLVGLKGMNIHAIDVNSGVESQPGFKDIKKINELIEELKLLEL
jgi:phosphoribosylanthranilate isomerase